MSSKLFKPSSKLTKWSLLLPTILSGCAMGSREYSCPANMDGVRCLSTREVYERTHHGQVPGPTVIKKGRIVKQTLVAPAVAAQPAERSVSEPYVAPKVMDSSTPIRTPAQVMRIWIAPWEEVQGDLVMSGYVYTEIEPRRWAVGLPAAKSSNGFTPLSATRSTGTTNTTNTNQEKK